MHLKVVASRKDPDIFTLVFRFGIQCMIWSIVALVVVGAVLMFLGSGKSSPLGVMLVTPLIVNVFAWMIFATVVAPAWYNIRKHLMQLALNSETQFKKLGWETPSTSAGSRGDSGAWWAPRYGNRKSAERA